ncbi:MAG TPA: DUF3108 domain-containing protein [Spongiibacteraceae bacterium]|jgi:hypothetical protein
MYVKHNFIFAPANILLIGALLFAATLSSAAQPVPFEATYETSYGIMSARGERKLQADTDGLWKMENNAHVLMVSVIERSTFSWQHDRVNSQTYEFINPLSQDRSLSLTFDWPHNTVTDNGSKRTLQLAPGVYDKLSYQAQMQMNVCANPDKYPGEDFTVVDRNKLKTYRVELVGREVQKTPAGMLTTIHLKQFRPDKRDGKDTQIWLAADWHCLLVRLDQHEGNDIISLKLVSAKVDGVEVKEKTK